MGGYPVEHEPIRRHCQMLGRVDLELWLENAREVTVPGTAAVILPVRS